MAVVFILVAVSRLTVGSFGENSLILVHLALSSICLVHDSALVIDYGVAVIS